MLYVYLFAQFFSLPNHFVTLIVLNDFCFVIILLIFPQLLGTPQFQDVIKIKTIGSTYMAASGLNNIRNVKTDTSITERWDHLATLVEFALELKKALQCINEQSFNHFVLKMGINHGPITAGVIGARKPHYDIWVCCVTWLKFIQLLTTETGFITWLKFQFILREIR